MSLQKHQTILTNVTLSKVSVFDFIIVVSENETVNTRSEHYSPRVESSILVSDKFLHFC